MRFNSFPHVKLRVLSYACAIVLSGAYVTSHAALTENATGSVHIDKNNDLSSVMVQVATAEGAKTAVNTAGAANDSNAEAKKDEPEKKKENQKTETQAEKEQRKLAAELSLHDEKLRAQYIDLRSEYQRLKWENDLITEKMTHAKLKRDQELSDSTRETDEKLAELLRQKELLTEELAVEKLKGEVAQKDSIAEYETKLSVLTRDKMLLTEQLDKMKLERELAEREGQVEHETELVKLRRESELLKEKVSLMMSRLEEQDTEAKLKITRFDTELALMSAENKRHQYADKKPVYLEEPLLDDGTLVVSDRRIALNDPITRGTADYVSERINFFNNKNTKYPIFIVIDASPGGSVLEGLRIVKAMEGSEAPVYVVVKSLAASMAATITAMADRSFTYPNAYFVHHQISTIFFGKLNLSQKKEFYENSKKLWTRVATPIADKMGITSDEFIKKMYDNSLAGDWIEFGTEAKELKWVDHVVQSIRETSLVRNPDIKDVPTSPETVEAKWASKDVALDDNGKPYVYLPRLFPHDYYYLYNPDSFYRVR